nr:FAD-binding protein [Actinomycetota bacterium]
GLHTAVLTGEPADQAAVITAWRRRVQPAGATVTVRDRPAGVETHLDAVGPPPSAAALMAAVKAQLDPDHRCAPGRFRGWF